jgi:formylglycine-generating enzyme required for sulfatase activity
MTGNNPSTHRTCGSSCPVEVVTWFGAVAYANALSQRDGYAICYEKPNGSAYDAAAATAKVVPNWRLGLDCAGYRLPTEAEWEYAARAGSTTAFFPGNASSSSCMTLDPNLDVAGWYCGNAGDTTHTSKGKRANAWGIYDMHGNAWEWVWDWDAPYSLTPVVDPTGPASGTQRQSRGGSYYSAAADCRSAVRSPGTPDSVYSDTGFRLVRSHF